MVLLLFVCAVRNNSVNVDFCVEWLWIFVWYWVHGFQTNTEEHQDFHCVCNCYEFLMNVLFVIGACFTN